MKSIFYLFLSLFFFHGCSAFSPFSDVKKAEVLFEQMPKTYLVEADFDTLPHWDDEEFEKVLESFTYSCKSSKTRELYQELCKEAETVNDPKSFLQSNFQPYMIQDENAVQEGLLTGYYEPHLHGSRTKTERYRYPLYETPKDLIVVDLSSIYPDLKNYRLRGKLEGNKVVPYYTREESASQVLDADVICYVDSEIDKFFLEIQGSGRITLDTNETIYVGYDNQNGHKYKAIGRYLVHIGALKLEDVSLQNIKKWLEENPQRVAEVLNYNDSVVYFKERQNPASGSLGLELIAHRSIAVDKRYIPLGSMLYLSAPVKEEQLSKIVLAQDTGGAIKGAVRADLFLGYGKEAMEIAGELKSRLQLWILLPKTKQKISEKRG